MIGLKRGTVILEPHREEWEIMAQEMIHTLKDVLKDDVIDVQHIGSTAVKSICAKPIIDIVVGVKDFDKIVWHNEALAENGVIYRREDHPGQHLYICGDLEKGIHTHYIHVVVWGKDAWNHYIDMRDYLNTNEEKAKEYSELKVCLARKYSEDRTAYTSGKSVFIEEVLNCAEEWRKHRIFGTREEVQYWDREGAYLIPVQDNKIGVIQSSKGYFFLGGGLESGESHSECIERECMEEAGCRVSIKDKVCTAEMYTVHPVIGYFHPIQTYYLGEVFEEREKTEEGHKFLWIEYDELKGKMYVEMQNWALEQCFKSTRIKR